MMKKITTLHIAAAVSQSDQTAITKTRIETRTAARGRHTRRASDHVEITMMKKALAERNHHHLDRVDVITIEIEAVREMRGSTKKSRLLEVGGTMMTMKVGQVGVVMMMKVSQANEEAMRRMKAGQVDVITMMTVGQVGGNMMMTVGLVGVIMMTNRPPEVGEVVIIMMTGTGTELGIGMTGLADGIMMIGIKMIKTIEKVKKCKLMILASIFVCSL